MTRRCSRFILNLPDEELASLERICFQVEQAYVASFRFPHDTLKLFRHWFYEDFIREENPKFPSLPLKKFSAMLFHACPLLHQWSHDHEQAFNNFMQYKTRVPVCGAIMLNDTWEKVGVLAHLLGLIPFPIRGLVYSCQGLEIIVRLGFPQGEDKRRRTRAQLRDTRGRPNVLLVSPELILRRCSRRPATTWRVK